MTRTAVDHEPGTLEELRCIMPDSPLSAEWEAVRVGQGPRGLAGVKLRHRPSGAVVWAEVSAALGFDGHAESEIAILAEGEPGPLHVVRSPATPRARAEWIATLLCTPAVQGGLRR